MDDLIQIGLVVGGACLAGVFAAFAIGYYFLWRAGSKTRGS
jgi:hypothetical protein